MLTKACGDDEMEGEKTKKIDKVKAAFETKKAAPKRGNLRAFMKARTAQPKEDFEILGKDNAYVGQRD